MIKITINHELRIFSEALFLIFISYLFFYYYLNIATIFEALTDVTKTGNGERGYAHSGREKLNMATKQRIGNKVIRYRELKERRRRRHKNGKEQQLCTYITLFFHISLPSSHDYDMKLPNFTLCGGREHMTTTLFLFLNFDTVL